VPVNAEAGVAGVSTCPEKLRRIIQSDEINVYPSVLQVHLSVLQVLQV
jgi:hypothetical protein